MTGENYFATLAGVDCSAHIEKKGRFSYLSWPFAISELLKRHQDAQWRVIENAGGWPYWVTPAGCFVKVGVTVNGIERVQIHPVLDQNNKTVSEPNAFQINTSIQRGLVKAIALHGLGLSIYAGEDVPAADDDQSPPPPQSISGGDPRVLVRASIARAGQDKGWTVERITADFAEWSNGVAIHEAPLTVLDGYLRHLKVAA